MASYEGRNIDADTKLPLFFAVNQLRLIMAIKRLLNKMKRRHITRNKGIFYADFYAVNFEGISL